MAVKLLLYLFMGIICQDLHELSGKYRVQYRILFAYTNHRVSKFCGQLKRLKHINVRYHFVQEVRGGTVHVIYIPSTEQITDLLTKSLGKVFEKFREIMFGQLFTLLPESNGFRQRKKWH